MNTSKTVTQLPEPPDELLNLSVTQVQPPASASGVDGWNLRRRRRAVAAVAVIAAASALAGWFASGLVRTPADVAAMAAPPPPSVITEQVQRRVLESDLVARAVVAPAQVVIIGPQATASGGRAVVTRTPLNAGDPVKAGTSVLEVSGRPVIVMPGSIPMYRDLRPGQTGRDVQQLQSALGTLGYRVSDSPGFYGSATKRAIAALYDEVGYEPTPASPDDEQQIADAQRQVTVASRALASAEQSTTTARPGSGAGSDQTVVYAREDLAAAKAALEAVRSSTGPMAPYSEIVFVAQLPAVVQAVSGVVGDAVPADAVTVSTGDLEVVAKVNPQDGLAIKPGVKARVFSEVTGQEFIGRVVATSSAPPPGYAQLVQDQGTLANPGQSLFVRVRPERKLSQGLAGQDVRLTLVQAATREPVLVVPVSAVSTGADGRITVSVALPDGSTRRVEVNTGLVGAGYVQVTPVDAVALGPQDLVVIGVQTAGSQNDPSPVEPSGPGGDG